MIGKIALVAAFVAGWVLVPSVSAAHLAVVPEDGSEVPALMPAAGPDAGGTALHWAARLGAVELVRGLVASGADANARDADGETALHWVARDAGPVSRREWLAGGAATESDVAAVVAALAATGVDVNARAGDGRTALHLAAQADAVAALVAAGADVSARANAGETALHLAAAADAAGAIAALVVAGAGVHVPDTEGWHPLHWAARTDAVDAVAALMTAGADWEALVPLSRVAVPGGEFLAASSTEGDVPVTGPAIHVAVEFEALDAVAALVAAGADVNARDTDGMAALCRAALRFDAAGAVRALVMAGAEVGTRCGPWDETPLHWAAYNADAATVEALLTAGVAVNVRDAKGDTPLHALVRGTVSGQTLARSLPTLLVLLERGAVAGLANSAGATPLDVAAYSDDGDAIALGEVGASVGTREAVSAADAVDLSPAAGSPLPASSDSFGECRPSENPALLGKRVVPPDMASWQVSLLRDGEHFCGGSLIHPSWVLTSAVCADGFDASRPGLTVMHGSHTLSAGGEHRDAKRVVVHEQWESVGLRHDIALIELATPFSVPDGQLARLPPSEAVAERYAFPGACGIMTGWGSMLPSGPNGRLDSWRLGELLDFRRPDRLQGVDVPIVDQVTCAAAYDRNETLGMVTVDHVCTGYPQGGKGSCYGDAGNPLVVPGSDGWMLAGIVSWARGCGQPDSYDVNTRVSRYLDWIQRVRGEGGAR